jgi:hypothetical protein
LVVAVLLLALMLVTLPERRVAGFLGIAGVAVAVGLSVAWRPDLLALTPVRLRWVNWQTAWSVLISHPLLGAGLGGIGQAGLATPLGVVNITPYAHNTYLQLVAELGIGGLGAVVLAVSSLVALVRRGLRSEPALALAVAVVPLHNLLDFSVYVPEVAIPWAVLAGTLAARVLPLPTRRRLSSWWLVAIIAAGALLATLEWRGALDTTAALGMPQESRVSALLTAARWRPWSCESIMLAAGEAVAARAPMPEIAAVDTALASCAWVRPRSASWAEARARLLLVLGRPGEAFAWAGEARRRAPLRSDLETLEAACRPGS